MALSEPNLFIEGYALCVSMTPTNIRHYPILQIDMTQLFWGAWATAPTYTLYLPPGTQPPKQLRYPWKGFFRGANILAITGMNDVPIILVLSTPCSHMAYHFRQEMTIELCINLSLDDRGLVKKNISYLKKL